MLYLPSVRIIRKNIAVLFDWDGGGTRLRPLFCKKYAAGRLSQYAAFPHDRILSTAVLEYATAKRYFTKSKPVQKSFFRILAGTGNRVVITLYTLVRIFILVSGIRI